MGRFRYPYGRGEMQPLWDRMLRGDRAALAELAALQADNERALEDHLASLPSAGGSHFIMATCVADHGVSANGLNTNIVWDAARMTTGAPFAWTPSEPSVVRILDAGTYRASCFLQFATDANGSFWGEVSLDTGLSDDIAADSKVAWTASGYTVKPTLTMVSQVFEVTAPSGNAWEGVVVNVHQDSGLGVARDLDFTTLTGIWRGLSVEQVSPAAALTNL